MDKENDVTLDAISGELAKAQDEYEACVRELASADRAKREALNRLNRIQKQFDERIESVRKNAPRDTDWAQRGT